MKIVIRTIVLLIFVNIALLYAHYSQLADASGEADKKSQYVQEIEVINRQDALIVRHHFRKLDPRRYEIILPPEAEEFTCFLETESSCSRINETVTALVEGEDDRQSISYKIPKEKEMVNRKLFKEPFATLKDASPASTILHITDETLAGGMWVSGLELVGRKKINLIDYSLFKGEGHVADLYWQQKELPLAFKGKALSVFGESIDKEIAGNLNDELLGLNANHIVVVIDPRGKPLETNQVLVTGQDLPSVVNAVHAKGVRSQYVMSTSEKLVPSLVTSILTSKPSGTERAKAVFGALKENLSEEQFEELKLHLANQKGEKMDAATLDRLIGQVSGLKTSFVQRNNEASYPFFFEDKRQTSINGKIAEGIQIIIKDGKTLFPASAVLEENGYNVSANEKSLYVKSASKNYRFSLRDPFYVLNEKKYTLREMPYERIGEQFYFEEDSLRRLFQLSIQKNEDSITITSLTRGESE